MIQEASRSEGYYGVGFDLMAAIQIAGAEDIAQADVDTIGYEVWDRKDPNRIVDDDLDATDVVFDTRQTDNGWNRIVDPDGFNFLWPVPGALVPNPNREYVFLITITLTDDEVIRHKHIHRTWSRT